MLSIRKHKNGLYYVVRPDESIVCIRTTRASAQVVVDAGGAPVAIAVLDYTDAHDRICACAKRLADAGWPAHSADRDNLRSYQEQFKNASARLGCFTQAEIRAEFVRRGIR